MIRSGQRRRVMKSDSADASGGEEYVVQQGDCLESIAYERGLLPNAVWNDARNEDLRQKRQNPNVLLAGDLLFVPDKTLREVSGATEQRHRFRRKAVPAWFRVRLFRNGEPRTGLKYVLKIDDQLYTGETDREGKIAQQITPDAQGGSIRLFENGRWEEYPIRLGYLDPADEAGGAWQRLSQLGYDVGENPAEEAGAALRQFQKDYGLKETGELDDATTKRLAEAHEAAEVKRIEEQPDDAASIGDWDILDAAEEPRFEEEVAAVDEEEPDVAEEEPNADEEDSEDASEGDA